MKFLEPRRYADPEVAVRMLMEIASSVEPVLDGRIHIEKIDWPFLSELKGSPAEYDAGLKLAIERGWLWTVVSALTLSAKLLGLLREKIEVGVAGQFGGAQTAAEIVAIFIEENDIRMT
jgi:hypothetical protein